MIIGDLRCGSKLHGKMLEHSIIEVKCDSRFCGARRGVVVLHRFDLSAGGMLIGTKRFSDPSVRSVKGAKNGTR